MKYLRTYENNKGEEYLYLIHWEDKEGFEVVSEGYLQKNSWHISEDGIDDLKIVQKVMELDIDEKMYCHNKEGEQQLNGYIHYIQKIRFSYEPIDPNFKIKIYGKKYNI